ncbi:B12-binding domain-containing radical SAM protein [Candidatus Omnitrophota bacterium]
MRITLIQPYDESHLVLPPLGLGYLAASLEAKGHVVAIIDCVVRGLKGQALLRAVKKSKPELVGITVMSAYYARAKKIVSDIKRSIGCVIVIGGPHVSALPEFSMEDTEADFAVVGEGEETFGELLSRLEAKDKNFLSIKGICYRNPAVGKITRTPARELVDDLNRIPFPAWHLIAPDKYPPTPQGFFYKRFPTAPVITSRGCPYECSFCASAVTWRRTIRKRSAKNIADEIELLVNKFGVKEIHFVDDNFSFSREHTLAICDELIKRKLAILWACTNGLRIDTLDKELLAAMKKAGCYFISVGVESGSQDILDRTNKNLSLKALPGIIMMIKEAGIKIGGFFIIGLPGETRLSLNKTLRLARKLPFDKAQFSRFTPLPGTLEWDHWPGGKELHSLDWSTFRYYGDSPYSTGELSNRELACLQRRAFWQFYLRPATVLEVLKEIRPSQAGWLIKRARDYFF